MRCRIGQFTRLALALTAAVIASSCIHRYPYEHFVFQGEFRPIQDGAPDKKWTSDVREFPVVYELKRQQYTLIAAIDSNQYSPTAVFVALAPDGSIATVVGEPIKCLATFWPFVARDIQAAYPMARESFVWRPAEIGACISLTDDLYGPKQVQLSVSVGDQLYREAVTFAVVANGTMFAIDAL